MNNEVLVQREKIEDLDKKLLSVLEKRFEVSKKIGQIKKQNNFLVNDPRREKQVLESRIALSNLNPKFLNKIFKEIFRESKKLQNES